MINLTKENFQTETATGLVLVDFWAAWCPPCRVIAPVLDKLPIKVGKVNADEEEKLTAEHSVTHLPTLVFYKDGRIVKRLTGLQGEAVLLACIKELS